MKFWTAESDMDYYDQLECHPRLIEFTCEFCGEPFNVPFNDGPPIGRPVCDSCKAELEEQRRRETLRQWVETQRQERK